MSDGSIKDIINGLIAQSAGIPIESLDDPQRRLDSLGIDSLGIVELLFDIEDQYGVRIDDPLQLKDLDLAQLHALVAELIEGRDATGATDEDLAPIPALVATSATASVSGGAQLNEA